MTTNYTLIHYLSDGDDYSMNCHVGSSSSDFSLFFFKNEEDIINKYAELLAEDHFEQNIFGSHEYTVLINGLNDANDWDEEKEETNPSFYRIIREAEKRSKTLIAAKQIELDEAAKQKAEKDKELEKQRIKNEIAYLQSKL